VLKSRDRVRIGIQGDRNRGVAEALLHDFGVDACLKRKGRVRMPEVMQPNPRQSCVP
jgi:hypothetical protein